MWRNFQFGPGINGTREESPSNGYTVKSALPTAADVGSSNWNEVTRSESLVLVDFWAPWCPWCRKLSPEFDSLSSEYKDRVKFVKLNVQDAPDVANKYGVEGLPTLKFFCQGRSVGEIVGYLPKPNLKAEVDKMLQIYKQCAEQSSPREQQREKWLEPS
jgi:thioredoxin 1